MQKKFYRMPLKEALETFSADQLGKLLKKTKTHPAFLSALARSCTQKSNKP